MKILIVFVILSILNVIFSTIKSITTIKSSPMCASLISALYYGYYNIVLIYTVADFPLWQKVLTTFVCNVVGVYIVKWTEKKMRKDRMWEIRGTTKDEEDNEKCAQLLKDAGISYNYIDVPNYRIFNCYSATQKESRTIRAIFTHCNAKYFAIEGKDL